MLTYAHTRACAHNCHLPWLSPGGTKSALYTLMWGNAVNFQWAALRTYIYVEAGKKSEEKASFLASVHSAGP